LLIAQGLNVVFVGRQLGHANPTITSAAMPTSTPAPTTPLPHGTHSKPAAQMGNRLG